MPHFDNGQCSPGIENENEDERGDDLIKMRQEKMKALEAARAALKSVADEFNKQMRADTEKNRRQTYSPGKLKRAQSPTFERKSTRLSGKPIVDYTGLDFAEDMRGNRRYRNTGDLDDLIMSKLTPGVKRRRHSVSTIRALPVNELKVEDVTAEMIRKINYMSTNKKYDPVHGKSCHQCRQKTTDTKSVCRSGFCFGVRGQFCGACLEDHYGEDLAEVLFDPAWSCPMCREICNCSFCRKKAGKAPLGIITGYVRNKGYKSVHHFLLEHEGPDKKCDDECGFIGPDDVFEPKKTRFSSSGLTIKLPFGKTKKVEKESESSENRSKSKKMSLRTKAEMEKLMVSMGADLPVTESKLLQMKQRLDADLEMDWSSLLNSSGEDSFQGFASKSMFEDLEDLRKMELRQNKFRARNLVSKQLDNLDQVEEVIEKSCDGI